MHRLVIPIAQLHTRGDSVAASELIDQVLNEIQVDQRPDIALLAVEALRRLDHTDASKLIDRVLDVERLHKSSQLWRYAAKVAENDGQSSRKQFV